jgi:hypothetical protein
MTPPGRRRRRGWAACLTATTPRGPPGAGPLPGPVPVTVTGHPACNGTPRRRLPLACLPLARLPGGAAGGRLPAGLGLPRPLTVLPSEFATR